MKYRSTISPLIALLIVSSALVAVCGCFWHGCPRCGHYPKANAAFWRAKIDRNRQRDRRTNRDLKKIGYAVARFWEHELLEDLQRCVLRIRTALDS